jgi:hypothetical protein
MANSRPSRRRSDLTIGDAWKKFYHSPEGRAALADFFVFCNVYSPINESDPIRLAMAEGERRAALRIIELMALRPQDIVQQAEEDTNVLDRMMRF